MKRSDRKLVLQTLKILIDPQTVKNMIELAHAADELQKAGLEVRVRKPP